jgi:hypothetical protein
LRLSWNLWLCWRLFSGQKRFTRQNELPCVRLCRFHNASRRDDEADIERVYGRNDKHDDHAGCQAVVHIDGPALPQDRATHADDKSIHHKRWPLQAEQVAPEAVRHILIEQDREFFDVARILAQPVATLLIERIGGCGVGQFFTLGWDGALDLAPRNSR